MRMDPGGGEDKVGVGESITILGEADGGAEVEEVADEAHVEDVDDDVGSETEAAEGGCDGREHNAGSVQRNHRSGPRPAHLHAEHILIPPRPRLVRPLL
jgi:hypothetical protein